MRLRIYQALNLTIEHFGIKSQALADASGMSKSRLSLFRNNHQSMRASLIDALLDAMTPEQRKYLFSLLLLEDHPMAALEVAEVENEVEELSENN